MVGVGMLRPTLVNSFESSLGARSQELVNLQRAELTTVAPGTPLPMNAVWRTIRSYILWQHERGTLHYDIMVTLILIFIFFSPRVINFNDKPISRDPHPTEVVVTSDTEGRLI